MLKFNKMKLITVFKKCNVLAIRKMKPLQQINNQSGLCRETLQTERYHESNRRSRQQTTRLVMTNKTKHENVQLNTTQKTKPTVVPERI